MNNKVFFGGDDRIYCLNVSTGKKIWSTPTEQSHYGADSSPAVVDGKVVVGAGDRKIYCLNASNGAVIWTYKTGVGLNGRDYGVCSSPAIVYNRVYVGACDGCIYCLNLTTGTLVWKYYTGNNVYSSPCVLSGKVYVDTGSYNAGEGSAHKVFCLDAFGDDDTHTTTKVWEYETDGNVISSPAVANGRV